MGDGRSTEADCQGPHGLAGPASRLEKRVGSSTRLVLAQEGSHGSTNKYRSRSSGGVVEEQTRNPAANSRSRDTMNTSSDERFTVLRSIGEFIYEHELSVLLQKKLDPICYVWFEPSLTMDIEQGIMKTIYINKMLEAGCTVKILMADWFLQQHPRIGTDLNKIRAIGQYNIEMWKAAGMHLERVELIWLSDELDHHAVDYWTLAMDVSRKYTMERIASYCEYVKPYGPKILPAAEIFYPCMLVAVVLCQKLKVDIWLFSKDQRDFIMLARDYCEDINMGRKPTFLLHNILPSLLEDPEFQNEMDPGQTIFMQDEEDDLDFKMWRMFCPPKVAVCNPCLEYIRSLVFPWFGKFEVVQKEGNGSNNLSLSISVETPTPKLSLLPVRFRIK
ncbi:tyrosine--tRNA ligase 1, cytoplasmic-like isoform X3 [Miscanthus floridulus]|uniref:tyrosine--tRNA ligase 1, cytoplasmic-like isoform X3 n=1 Tax=Miscanthus floridulus TaxID=154761 RepID=UPI0034573F08